MNEKQEGPFYVTQWKLTPKLKQAGYVIAIRCMRWGGGHFLFRDYEDRDKAQQRCDKLNAAVMEWMVDYLDRMEAAND